METYYGTTAVDFHGELRLSTLLGYVASYIQQFIQDRLDNRKNESLDVLLEEITDEEEIRRCRQSLRSIADQDSG